MIEATTSRQGLQITLLPWGNASMTLRVSNAPHKLPLYGPGGLNTAPRTHETASAEPKPVLRGGNTRRGSLSELQPKADVSPRARHSSATQ